ncbi:hypothetical protein D3C73_1238650 [compost metagenome]
MGLGVQDHPDADVFFREQSPAFCFAEGCKNTLDHGEQHGRGKGRAAFDYGHRHIHAIVEVQLLTGLSRAVQRIIRP